MGPAGAQGPAGPAGPAGPMGSGALAEDVASFAGFTVATFTGNLGGRPAAHAACGAEFSGAHLCHAAEYLRTHSSTLVPAAGAWLDGSVTVTGSATLQGAIGFGRNTYDSCENYTFGATNPNIYGTLVAQNGSLTTTTTCGTPRALACCNGPSKPVFAGFTAQAYPGDMGGRPAVHGICSAAFPGSHLCHAAEYLRTQSSTPVPPEEAWLDASVTQSNGGTLQGGPSYGRNTYDSCENYTFGATNPNIYGTRVLVNGALSTTTTCGTPRRVACCY
ncbi:uncharacterized protein CMC5_036500 [Chondromyces crocatus]|uniref:Uncharacterized protein n=2 Tax=Chondromyces crocatus TaxID=52 RepID=A0A0K1EFZ2_CHOCO|nr:uncharacterized protein CMC5_036500 [Chondromyces crocatus]